MVLLRVNLIASRMTIRESFSFVSFLRDLSPELSPGRTTPFEGVRSDDGKHRDIFIERFLSK